MGHQQTAAHGNVEERRRALTAFVELIAVQGYEATSEEQVARRAKISPQAFRALFEGGKEQCAIAAEDAILAEVVSAVACSYSADRSEWDSVIFGVKAILELMAANPSSAFLGYIAARQMAPRSVQRGYESGHQMLEAMLERGQTYAQGDPRPPMTARGVLGGPEAIIRREVAAGRAAQLPRLLPDFVYAATVPFLGQEEALRLARRSRELLAGSP